MNAASQCPDRALLEQFASGQLAPDAGREIESHTLECGECFEALQKFQKTDAVLDALRHLRTLSAAAPRGAMMEKLMGEVRRLSESGVMPALPQGPLTPVSGITAAIKAAITFACAKCGRRLRMKPDFAGKRVKCPGCGEVTVAPAAHPSLDGAPAEHREAILCLAPPHESGELGRLGGYRVLKIVGAGGMGVVFRAEDVQLKRTVALKAMLPSLGASESARKRFGLEARSAAAIKHDHIVSIYQVGEERGIPFLAMEFLEGESLDDRLTRERKLPIRDVVRIGRQVAEGLAAAHERKLIHRDIKPANIWLEFKKDEGGRMKDEKTASTTPPPRSSSFRLHPSSFRIKILDFGLARAMDQDQFLTQSGAIVGTPAFMAPEQSRGESLDGRCDLFSLGVVLYRAATGEQPFRGKDSVSVLMAIAMETPADPRTLEPAIPADLAGLILKLLEKDPAKRPDSAEEVAEKLEAMEGGATGEFSVTGLHAALPSTLQPPPKRSRWPMFAAAVVLAVVLAVACGVAAILIAAKGSCTFSSSWHLFVFPLNRKEARLRNG